MNGGRLYRLRPWLVRAMVPSALIGTYVLYRDRTPVYIGRSDRDLQQRLLQHSAAGRGDYFTYDIHRHPLIAFDVECSLFHALNDDLTNRIHPDHPNYQEAACPFCADALSDIRNSRLGRAPWLDQEPVLTAVGSLPPAGSTPLFAEMEIPRLSHPEGDLA